MLSTLLSNFLYLQPFLPFSLTNSPRLTAIKLPAALEPGLFVIGQIIAGAKKSEKQKELTESALSLKLGLFGFVLGSFWVHIGFVLGLIGFNWVRIGFVFTKCPIGFIFISYL